MRRTRRGPQAALTLALLLLVTGLTVNRWSLGRMLSPDGLIDNARSRRIILVFQGTLLAVAGLLLARRPGVPRLLAGLAAPPLVAASAFGLYGTALALRPPSPSQQRLALLERSESLYQLLSLRMGALGRSAMNLDLPDLNSYDFFADRVEVSGALAEHPDENGATRLHDVVLADWPLRQASERLPPREMRLWRPFFEGVSYLSYGTFAIIRGVFANDAETEWRSDMGFSALARLDSGRIAQASARIEALWSRESSADPQSESSWRIRSWRTVTFAIAEAPRPLFVEALDAAVPDAVALKRARTSLQEELIVKHFRDKVKPHEYFTYQALDRHPGLAVVDLDRDGLDDLYLMPEVGKNMLLHNRGDGTFVEVTAALGLDFDSTSSAVFADFDNDGDADAFLGRTLERSLYLVNEGGRFRDCSRSCVSMALPFLVSSVAAADYDGDGLLDVYFATYASDMFYEHPGSPERFLSPEEAREYRRRLRAGSHWLQERVGPPNLLLRNAGGGRFEVPPGAAGLAVWRHTYQATFADYNADGRPDLYVVNDFSTNNLFRNEGGGRFADVTAETGAADLGFGMGASFGDYDNDGRPDLYVSNMFSKAGNRIIDFLGPEAAEFKVLAKGNSLFRNRGGRFEMTSGTKPPAMMVEMAGWSWGSQFVDVDNDGFLDLHALSGYYTAPKEISIPVDT